jgi:hypothetical protein
MDHHFAYAGCGRIIYFAGDFGLEIAASTRTVHSYNQPL